MLVESWWERLGATRMRFFQQVRFHEILFMLNMKRMSDFKFVRMIMHFSFILMFFGWLNRFSKPCSISKCFRSFSTMLLFIWGYRLGSGRSPFQGNTAKPISICIFLCGYHPNKGIYTFRFPWVTIPVRSLCILILISAGNWFKRG